MAKERTRMQRAAYAWEKSYLAVRGMAASSQSIQRRVGDAYVYHLIHIHDENVTPDILARLDAVAERVTREPDAGDGTVSATVAKMTEDEARELANEITDIYWAICQLYLTGEGE